MLRKAVSLLLPLTLAVGLLLSSDALAAALHRNRGNLLLLGGPGPCDDKLPSLSVSVSYLEQAMRLRASAPSTWRTLLRVKGWSDRQWIRDALGPSPPDWVEPGALHRAADTLRPSSWTMRQAWTEERCRAAWDAWTLGLLWALDGRWTEAVAAYQAGLGLAPGRVPAEIVQEYYLALARHILAEGELSPLREAAAAKYLALGGERVEAAERIRGLLAGGALDTDRVCQMERWLAAVEAGGLPRDPLTCRNLDSNWEPDWVLPLEGNAAGQAGLLVDKASGRVLWGFDLDPDVLEAGVEVLGTLYWRAADGRVYPDDLYEANLWPNSGNAWLPLEGFSTCVPGYVEPAWVAPCAGSVIDLPLGRETENVAHIYLSAQDQGPDTFIATASAPILEDVWLVYGGWWRSEGNLQHGRLARYGGEMSDPRTYYETLLDLSDLPPGEWQARVRAIAPLGQEHDLVGWIYPQVGQGDGELAFDDLFGFAVRVP